MKTHRNLGFIIPFLHCAALAVAQTHVPEPPVNLGDTSFFDGVAGPGIVVEEIGDSAHSKVIVDAKGHEVPGTGRVNSISSLTHIAWLSRYRVGGGWYGAEVVVAAAHVNAGPGSTAGGLGDLTVSPLILQWNEKKLGTVAFDQRVVFDFDLPVGEYSQNTNLSLSSHAYTVHPYYAMTAFPLKRLETSWRVHYLWSSENAEPPKSFDTKSTQAGQAIHFNSTLSYGLGKHLWVGGNGYFLKQISDPKIDGIAHRNSPEQVGALGPGAVWNHGQWFLYVNGYHELGAENRPTGNKLVLRVEKVFGKEG
ncbi:transporter [Alloacidobacterium dinghuense]|uniref:Transporter n=1 Tax=Alloacidobacterium dinghuense TaxID=2763107 RepID=A0A7G8BLJ9_9BACT|nr:transporter [Alloacidobacterium dinghuense]QNI33419.1 transporter [Alloacidobacterium dinghuense]